MQNNSTGITVLERYFNDRNITGKGEIITVIDTLIDIYHSMFRDDKVNVTFQEQMTNHRKFVFYNYPSDLNNWIQTIQADEHGTHVSGTAAGKNDCSNEQDATEGPELFDGNAPDAKILYAGQLNTFSVQEQLDLMVLLGSKNVLTIGALGEFYSSFHVFLLQSLGTPSYQTELISMIDPEPYQIGTIGTTQLASSIVLIDAAAPGNNCNTIDQPQISVLYAENGDQLLWTEGCNIEKSHGIFYTYQIEMLQNILNAGPNVYLQGITKYNNTPGVTHAPYSSTGPANKGVLKPDVMAPGTRIISAKSLKNSNHDHGCNTISDDGLIFMQGTSMATPNAAGAAALIHQYFKTNWSVESIDIDGPTVRALMINSCIQQPQGSLTPNTMFGHGHLDLSTVLPVEKNFES